MVYKLSGVLKNVGKDKRTTLNKHRILKTTAATSAYVKSVANTFAGVFRGFVGVYKTPGKAYFPVVQETQ